MILSIIAFGIGCVIGRLRGGGWAGVTSARINGVGWLILGITSMLVLNLIGPAVPLVWAIAGTIGFIVFGLQNLQITGMIVMLIGLLMNTAPLLVNGATPVSDLALTSVGDIDDAGLPAIDGLRESTETATRLQAFGDVIPVPVVNSVVSIGDMVMLIALADIAAHLLIRARRRNELDDAGVTFASEEDEAGFARVEILSPLNHGVTNRPAHAAHRRPRRKAAPSNHVPAHAKEPGIELARNEPVIMLDGSTDDIERPAPPIDLRVPPGPETPATEVALPPTTTAKKAGEHVGSGSEAPDISNSQFPSTIIDLTDPADHRPIIDLTISPTDEQLCEFLRRREAADVEVTQRPTPGPGMRRGRAPRRNAGVVEVPR